MEALNAEEQLMDLELSTHTKARTLKPKLVCQQCDRSFTQQTHLSRHQAFCELLLSTAQSSSSSSRKRLPEEHEHEHDQPTSTDIYLAILELTQQYKQLNSKVDDLSKCMTTKGMTSKKKQKVDILEYLDTLAPVPTLTVAAWLQLLPTLVTQQDLALVVERDIVAATVNVWIKHKPASLRAFKAKPNQLYGFQDDGTWALLTPEAFLYPAINATSRALMHEFTLWQNTYKPIMNPDVYAERFAQYVKKMMGNLHYSQNDLNHQMARQFYKAIAETVEELCL
jgi:hypothetical protein